MRPIRHGVVVGVLVTLVWLLLLSAPGAESPAEAGSRFSAPEIPA